MAEQQQQHKPTSRGVIARQFDAMTLALFVVALCVAACVAFAIGPDEAASRIGCGLNDVLGVLLPHRLPCG